MIILVLLFLIYLRPWPSTSWVRHLAILNTAPWQVDASTQTEDEILLNEETQTDITYLVQPLPDMRTFLDRGCQTNSLLHGNSHNTLEALHLDLAAVRNYNTTNRLSMPELPPRRGPVLHPSWESVACERDMRREPYRKQVHTLCLLFRSMDPCTGPPALQPSLCSPAGSRQRPDLVVFYNCSYGSHIPDCR